MTEDRGDAAASVTKIRFNLSTTQATQSVLGKRIFFSLATMATPMGAPVLKK